MPSKFQCTKCGHSDFNTGEIRASGGFWTKFFNIQNLTFRTLTCEKCGYTELYQSGTDTAENILDFFGN